MKTYDSGGSGEKLREVACNLCGSDDSAPFLRGDGFSYVKCRRCGLVYQNPQPIFEDLRKRYGDGYFEYELENDRNFFNLMQLGLRDVGFYAKPASAFDNNRFLDVGCATGMLVQEMQERGWDAQGVEICEPAAQYGRDKRGVQIFVGTLEDAGFADNSFSVIHFSHLIEHVPDPLALLSEVRRILTKRGTIIVTSPNVCGFQARLFGAQWRSAISDHLTLFSKKTLRLMLAQAGFRAVRGVTWGGLAKGTVPGFIKKPVDALAKKLGFGDVVLYEAVPAAANAKETDKRDTGSSALGGSGGLSP